MKSCTVWIMLAVSLCSLAGINVFFDMSLSFNATVIGMGLYVAFGKCETAWQERSMKTLVVLTVGWLGWNSMGDAAAWSGVTKMLVGIVALVSLSLGCAMSKPWRSNRKWLADNRIDGLLLPYQCHKQVHAKPMSKAEYYELKGREAIPEDVLTMGYFVVYGKGTKDEYESWLPQQVFDDGYTLIKQPL